jgi:protocatechuate 3,4-dioxygenase beta subunit
MKKLLFAFLALGALLLGFLLVVLVVTPASSEKTTTTVTGPKVESPKQAAAPAAPEQELVGVSHDVGEEPADAEDVALPATSARSVVAALEGARAVGTWTSSERNVVRGRIRVPAGAPADPTLSVLAFRSEPDSADVYGRFGALSRYTRDRRGIDSAAEDRAVKDADGEDDALIQPALEPPPEEPYFEGGGEPAPPAPPSKAQPDDAAPAPDEPRASHLRGMVAIAPVAADGTFEIPFPTDVEAGWLAIDGRYLYTSEPRVVAPSSAKEVALEVELGAWVTGAVSVPNDLADREATLQKLRVTLAYDPSRFSFTEIDFEQHFDRLAVPDGTGRFEFRGVPTAPPYVVTASSDDLADAVLAGVSLDGARDRHVEVAMVHGARVTGTVLDGSGAPAEGATVRAANGELFGFATNDVGHAVTDAEGRFELPHLPPGKVQITGRLKGFLDSRPKSLQLADREVRTDVQLEISRGERVAGVVRLPGGAPAAGVEVDLGFDPDALGSMAAFNAARGADGEAVTVADGRFEITGLGRGPFAVSVVHEIDGVGHAARVSAVKPGTLDLELELRPDPVLSGVVTALDGTPIQAFEVRAEQEGVAFWMGGESVERGFDDPDGAFQVSGMRAGRWKVRASADGWATSEWQPVELPRPEGAAPVSLVLAPEATAAGVVLDPHGKPVAGAMVRQELDLVQTIADAAGVDDVDAARTDEEGRFELGGLATGAVSLVASHPGHVDSKTVAVEVASGTRTDGVTLQLRVGGVLTGEVFDDDGEPAGGVQIVIQETTTFLPTMMRAEPDGTFRRESMKPGKYQITAMIGDVDANELFTEEDEGEPDWASFLTGMRTDIAEIEEGEETHVVLGAPPSDPVHVTGTVRHADGPVRKAMVTMLPEGSVGIGAFKYTQTNDEGEFEVKLDHPGNYLLQVQILGENAMAQNAMEFPQVVPEGQEHHVDVELPGGRITGRVIDRDGNPIPNTRVSLTVDGGVELGSFLGKRYVEQRTDADGRYVLEHLDPDVYVVSAGGTIAGGAFGGAAEAGRVSRGGLVLRDGEWVQDVDFRLREPGEVSGQVVDVTGSPVEGASIFVRDEQGFVLERFSMCATDGAGRFRYSGVAPGKYTLSARTADLASLESRPVVVPEGGIGQAVITVEAGTMLIVSVVDPEGAVQDPKILVVDEDGRQVNGMVSYTEILSSRSRLYSTEEQSVGPLPPGSYTVTARASDGRAVTKPVTLSGQAERRLKIRLR